MRSFEGLARLQLTTRPPPAPRRPPHSASSSVSASTASLRRVDGGPGLGFSMSADCTSLFDSLWSTVALSTFSTAPLTWRCAFEDAFCACCTPPPSMPRAGPMEAGESREEVKRRKPSRMKAANITSSTSPEMTIAMISCMRSPASFSFCPTFFCSCEPTIICCALYRPAVPRTTYMPGPASRQRKAIALAGLRMQERTSLRREGGWRIRGSDSSACGRARGEEGGPGDNVEAIHRRHHPRHDEEQLRGEADHGGDDGHAPVVGDEPREADGVLEAEKLVDVVHPLPLRADALVDELVLVRAREEQPEQHDGRAAEGDEADVHARRDGALLEVEGRLDRVGEDEVDEKERPLEEWVDWVGFGVAILVGAERCLPGALLAGGGGVQLVGVVKLGEEPLLGHFLHGVLEFGLLELIHLFVGDVVCDHDECV
mmetsp:Transcript_42843/g.138994  ORF Transcript_42843/g.138994 Transcript_42843/m.138994 type:complete len:429 (+) Transcript_42843:353-1639(+)